MANRSQGLDKDEMKLVLKKLAQFHAASAVHFKNNGQISQKFQRGCYNHDMMDLFDSHFEFNFQFLINECFSSFPNLEKDIIDKMVSSNASIFPVFSRIYFLE
jgi:hypothetical protein